MLMVQKSGKLTSWGWQMNGFFLKDSLHKQMETDIASVVLN